MIYLADCLEKMQDIPSNSIDLILTDLPYGLTKESWDQEIDLDLLWKAYNRIAKATTPILLFGQEPFSSKLRLSNLPMYKYDLYWEKERATNVLQVKRRFGKTIETISVFYKKQPTYNPQMQKHDGPLRSNKICNGKLGGLVDSGNKKVREYHDTGLRYPTQLLHFKRDILTSNLHPTQKPVALLEFLIKSFTNEGDIVLDSCMGSGSTGVACQCTDREFIGIEKDPKFFEIARSRLDGQI